MSLRFAQDWIPASAGNADEDVRFHSGWSNINGVTLGLVPGVLVDCFVGIDAKSPRCANRDARHKAEHDSEAVGGFLKLIAGRRQGQVFARLRRVPITVSAVEDHPERCRGALHEAHENAQRRLQQKLDEQRVA